MPNDVIITPSTGRVQFVKDTGQALLRYNIDLSAASGLIIDSPLTSSVGIKSPNLADLSGSNTFAGTTTFNGATTINGNLSVYGATNIFSASNIYITSSVLTVTDNILTLNALSPYQRYAGIEMYDTGSGTVSSILWDGTNDYFFLTGSGVNGKLITGPDGQTNLTSNYIPKATAGFKLGNSLVYDDGTYVGINTTAPSSSLTVQSNATQLRLQASSAPGSFFANVGARYDSTRPFTIEVANNNSTAAEFFGIYADSGGSNNRIALLNGNVGIGLTNPSAKFHITSSTNADEVLIGTIGNDQIVGGRTGGSFGISTKSTSNGNLILTSGDAFYIRTSGSNDRVIVKNDGNFGIGTTNPTSKLHIVTTGTNDGIILDGTSNPIFVHRTSGSDRTYLATTTNAGAFFTDAGQYDFIIRSQTNNILLGRGSGASTMAIVGNNVGIGTTLPSASLHIKSSTSGATLLRTDGTNGTLFSVVDDLSDSLMSVNNSAGLPVLEVFADDRIVAGQYGQNDLVVINNKIGIGTNNPIGKLHVTGSVSTPAAVLLGDVGVGTTAPTNQTNYRFLQVNGTNSAVIETMVGGSRIGGFDSTANTLYVGTIGSYPIVFRTAVDEKMRISANGNVGIGTTSPTQKLDVSGSARFTNIVYAAKGILSDSSGVNPVLEVYNTVATNATTAIIRQTTAGGNGNQDIGLLVDIQGAGDSDRIANFRYYDGSTYTSRMAILRSGNVGIGTIAPTTPLHVVGVISGSSFSGAGTGLTGTATSLTVGNATSASYALVAATANNVNNGQLSFASGSGITISAGTFTANQSGNTAFTISLSSNSVTVGSTAIALGGTATTIAGLSSVTSTGFTGSLVGTSSWASNVVTNANLTGDVTSVGNATTIANNAVTTVKIADANVTNAKLANSSLTIGSTAISLGGTATTIAGLSSLTSTNLTASNISASATGSFGMVGIGTSTTVYKLHQLGTYAQDTGNTANAVGYKIGYYRAVASQNVSGGKDFVINGVLNGFMRITIGWSNESGCSVARMVIEGNCLMNNNQSGYYFTGYKIVDRYYNNGLYYALSEVPDVAITAPYNGNSSDKLTLTVRGADTAYTGLYPIVLVELFGNYLTTPLSISTPGTTTSTSWTQDNRYLQTNNTTRLFISASGEIGIGTTSPTQQLEVAGYSMAGIGAYRTSIYGNNGGSYLYFGTTSSLASLGSIGAYGALFNINSLNNDISFQYSGAEKMRITTGGHLGLGITDPTAYVNSNGTWFRPSLNGLYSSIYATTEAVVNLISSGSADGAAVGGVYFTRARAQGDAHFQIAAIKAFQAGTSNTIAGGTLYFYTKNNNGGTAATDPAMVIGSGGNVGIGTSGPVAKLHISGSGQTILRLDSDTTTNIAQVQVKANGDGVLIAGMYGTASAGNNFGVTAASQAYVGTTTLNSGYPSSLVIGNVSSIPIAFSTNNTERMRIDGSGYVGIGTSSPSYKLHVNGGPTEAANQVAGWFEKQSSTDGRIAHFTNSTGSGYSSYIYIGSNPGRDWKLGKNVLNSGTTGHFQITNDLNQLRMQINAADDSIIFPTGSVGIGTTSPGAKLDVVGGIRFTSNLLTHKVAAYTTPYPGINSFGAAATDANITYYNTGKKVLNTNFRGVVWTGKHYIFTDYSNYRAYFYDNNFTQITNAYGYYYVTLPLPAGGYNSPHGAAWDGRYLWVVVYTGSNSKIIGYDLDTTNQTATIIAESAALSPANAYDVEYADGHLYLINSGTLFIYKWNGSSIDAVSSYSGAAGTITAQAITYDGSYLWATQNGLYIYKIGLDGTPIATITGGYPPDTCGWAWNGSNIVTFDFSARDIYIINTTRLRIDTQNLSLMGGNVGIGTTTPTSLLNIRASAPTSTGTVTTGTNLLIDSNTSNYITFRNTADNGTYAGLLFLDNNIGGYIAFGNAGASVGSDSLIYGAYQDHIFQNGYVNENLYNRTETMRIKASGNVGIGTSSPVAKLHVIGDISGSGQVRAPSFYSNGAAGTCYFETINIGTGVYIEGGANEGIYFGDSNRWIIDTCNAAHNDNADGELHFRDYTNSITRMLIQYSTGNIGMGITTPSASLHVKSTTSGATLLRTDGTNGTLFSVVDDLSDSLMSVNNSAGLPVLEVFADDRIVAGQYGQNDFVVRNNYVGIGTNNPTAKLYVTSSTSTPSALFLGGNVGIGTTNPVYRLQVSGQTFLNNGTSNALQIQTVVADTTTRDAIYLYEDSGAATGRQAISWYNGNQSYYKARLWTEVGANYQATQFGIDVADDARTVATRLLIRNGNVGIGTTLPQALLHVFGNISGSAIYLTNTSTADSTPSILLNGNANTERAIIIQDAGSNKWWFGRDNSGTVQTGIGFYNYATSNFEFYITDAGTAVFRNTITGTTSGNLVAGFDSTGTVRPRTAVTTYRDHNAASVTDAAIRSLTNSDDNWIYLDSANAQWGIYHRNIDTNLVVAGEQTLLANSIAYIGNNSLVSYICLADGSGYYKGGLTAASFSGAGTGLTGTAASLTAGTATNATQFGGESNTNFMRGLSSASSSSLDTLTANGFRIISYTGHSKGLLTFSVGGSIGTVQHEYFYNTPANGWRVRNYTDSNTWSAWGNVVMTDTNQGLLTGTVLTTNYSGTVSGLNIGGNAATVTTNANLSGDVTSTGNSTTIANNAVTTVKISNSNVTYAKIQNVSNSTVLGRITAGAGVVEELTGANIATIIGSNAVTNATNATTATTANALNASNQYSVTGITGSIQTTAVRETFSAISSATTGAIDLSTATVFNLAFSSSISVFSISNVNTSKVNSFTLISAGSGTAATITWNFITNGGASTAVKWAGTAPTATTTSGRFDVFSFVYDGTRWFGFTGGLNYN